MFLINRISLGGVEGEQPKGNPAALWAPGHWNLGSSGCSGGSVRHLRCVCWQKGQRGKKKVNFLVVVVGDFLVNVEGEIEAAVSSCW